MRVSLTTFSISSLAVCKAVKRSRWFDVIVFGQRKAGINPNTMGEVTKPLGSIVSLMALMLFRKICLSLSDLCSVLRMLNILRSGLLYRSPCTMELWDSIPLNCMSPITSFALLLKFSDVNDVSL